ncbi:MAG: hypothetical protein QM831_00660 [Kofleriaceae bacterium]
MIIWILLTVVGLAWIASRLFFVRRKPGAGSVSTSDMTVFTADQSIHHHVHHHHDVGHHHGGDFGGGHHH